MHHFALLVLAGCCLLGSAVDAQTWNMGRCPTVSVKTDFDLAKYAGTWYENRKNRRYWVIMDSGLRCSSETYTVNNDGTITTANKGLRVLNGRTYSAEGSGRVVSPGKLAFTFPSLSFSPKDVPYWVLDTDYTNYAVVWSCSERGRTNAQVTWILTREPQPDPSVVKTALDVLDRNNLGRTSMIPTLQGNCKYDQINKKLSKFRFK